MWEGIFVNSGKKKIKTDLQKKRLQTVCVHNNSERNMLDEKAGSERKWKVRMVIIVFFLTEDGTAA